MKSGRINKVVKDFPELDYVNYTDSYISQLNNETKKEENDNEFLEKTN